MFGIQGALFVVRRGVCMHGGRVLVAGSVWGEDFFADFKGPRMPGKALEMARGRTLQILKGFSWDMGVSENSGTTQIIHFNLVFHYKPSILGYPYFWKHP